MTLTLIHNGTLIDGNGGEPVANGALLIDGNRIVAAGPLAALDVPADAVRIDAGGGTILPGLIDTHVHMALEFTSLIEMASMPFSLRFFKSTQYMRRTIEAGITTVRDAGGADLGMKQAVEQGIVTGPRLMISTAPLGITGGHGDGWMPSGTMMSLFPEYPGMPNGMCDGVEAVRQRTREVLRAGAEVIKIMATGGVLSPNDHPEFIGFSEEELAVIVAEGKARKGIKVMAHAQGAEGIKMAVRAGIHSIEHGIYLDDEAIELMLEHGTYLVPTLLAPLSVVEKAKSSGGIPEYALRKALETIEAHQDSISRAYRAGVTIAMGTDAGVMAHGTNLRELGLMADVGMSPMEVLVATTRTAAECMGWQDRVGTLEPGKLADVVITRTDPLADLRSLEQIDNILLVMQDGNLLKDIRAAS
ncbi:MAG: amidohydrolase family protein [Phototrophicaceae bacterium]